MYTIELHPNTGSAPIIMAATSKKIAIINAESIICKLHNYRNIAHRSIWFVRNERKSIVAQGTI